MTDRELGEYQPQSACEQHEREFRGGRRRLDRKTATPARKQNVGAQKWVIHRVKKYAGVVCSTSVGSNDAPLMKSRT